MGKTYNQPINSSYSQEFLNWQDKFYSSQKWIRLRDKVKNKYFGICQICGKHTGTMIVHHIKEITPFNNNDSNIILNEDNLTLVCLDCHNEIHGTHTQNRMMKFDDDGNLIFAE